jgi:hypothetical protein
MDFPLQKISANEQVIMRKIPPQRSQYRGETRPLGCANVIFV